jgi:DNA gyrase subunit A
MIGFGIDEIQAEYIAEIRLRNINKEYILKRTEETSALEKEIADLADTLKSPARIRKIIIKELEAVADKYGADRKTGLVYEHETVAVEEEDETPDYPVTLFLSKEGYFKKITPQSLRMSGEQKFKEGDSLDMTVEATNRAELLVFTNQYQVYKCRCAEFDDSKASVLGDYLPTKLGMEDGEKVVSVLLPGDYSGNVLFLFENGKAAKVELSGYATKTNRRRLTGAYSDKSPLKGVFLLKEDLELVLYSTEGRALIFSTAQLAAKTTRSTQGVAVMTLKKKYVLDYGQPLDGSPIVNAARYRTRSLPAAGALLKDEDRAEKQVMLDI